MCVFSVFSQGRANIVAKLAVVIEIRRHRSILHANNNCSFIGQQNVVPTLQHSLTPDITVRIDAFTPFVRVLTWVNCSQRTAVVINENISGKTPNPPMLMTGYWACHHELHVKPVDDTQATILSKLSELERKQAKKARVTCVRVTP